MCVCVALGSAQGEITEKKSRFIAVIKEIHSEEEALSFIEDIRKQYWDARHNCYAYVLGRGNELQRFSDDREPSGTAGRPILDVLLGNGIRNAIIVVTRYFGGVLLGTGGLVRAYTDASLAAVRALKESGSLLPVIDGHLITFSAGYADISRFESLFMRLGMHSISKEYKENVIFKMVISDDDLELFTKEALNITRGAFTLEGDEQVSYCPRPQDAILYTF